MKKIFLTCAILLFVVSFQVKAVTYEGQFGTFGSGNGQFFNPQGISLDASGNIYVADIDNHRIQKFDSTGTYISQFGTLGSGNGQFDRPQDVSLDASGNIYVVDRNNNRIQKFDSTGTYISQFGTLGSGDGQLNSPASIVFDASGNIYVAESGNTRIQKFDSTGTYLFKFGTPGQPKNLGDGQFSSPSGIAFDAAGNIFVADTTHNRIQKFDSNGVFVSKFGTTGLGNGQLTAPYGIFIDAAGNIYVAEGGTNRIQKFDSTGVYVSQFGTGGSGDGQFNAPYDIFIDTFGNIYVADANNNRIQIFTDIDTTSAPTLPGSITTTEDETPTFTISCSAPYTVGLYASSTLYGTAICSNSGTVDITASTLTPGTYDFYSLQSNNRATSTPSATTTITIEAPVVVQASTPVVTTTQRFGGGSSSSFTAPVVASTPVTPQVPGCPPGFICTTQTPSAAIPLTISVPAVSLSSGQTTPVVKSLQQILNSLGFTVATQGIGSQGKESNYFGPATRAALIRFQKANNITPAVGFYGPITRAALQKLVK